MTQKTSPQKIPRLSKAAPPTASPANRWQAVVNRDPTATSFVYGVLTTKIFCRPSCPARLARRANVEFYDTPAQAERAGFRACKRCKPETLKPAVNPQVLLVQKACQTIKSDIMSGKKPTLVRLAGEAGLTPSHFHRVFKKVTGVTPGKYTAEAVSMGACEDFKGQLLDGDPLKDEKGDMFLFQPWDGELFADLDPWLVGLDAAGADSDTTSLWNDFDVLIAAEADYSSCQEVCPLIGAVQLGLSDPSSPNSGA